MYPSAFEYFAPSSVEEALDLLEKYGEDAKVMAGGQSLIPLLKLRFTTIPYIIDIGHIKDLNYIKHRNDDTEIGAIVKEHKIEYDDEISRRFPVMHDAAMQIADPVVRNMGTIGGDLCHGDPANDMPAVSLSLNAVFNVKSKSSERRINASDFFKDTFVTDLKSNEILLSIDVKNRNSTGAYFKYKRPAGDYSIAAVAVSFNLDNNVLSNVGIGLTSLANIPLKCVEAEEFLENKEYNKENIDKAADIVSKSVDPSDDINGSADFKRRVSGMVFKHAMENAYRRYNHV
ncbi:FAD binding domain-containing protein [Picrophilus oshimae]|uniref:Carbon monoxide dehydrogenase, medium chain n=1 Tax=Picrophilus torridus (strain ATCC 700027 / DSM 9790 / JCM 10055 / NBRC 100828 / KAW 2/3) TaxID=1122961 RepID=Q6KZZ8_PICTO|nr:xanthine dehydrogenase family protein subunit M [Picrophilus oshimae]AAT43704.1 carbon monoxide dehydrogenase, medium chain [Picrophilus oshimae DSM 9789]